MVYRENIFAVGEHYHLMNRGNNKQDIYRDDADRIRFLFLILYLQSPSVSFTKLTGYTKRYHSSGLFGVEKSIVNEIVKKRSVELFSFSLMPNHFHVGVREVRPGGISQYMQRVLNAYTKYCNTRHDLVGHIFQGPYKPVHVDSNEQLLYLSAYIHSNATEILPSPDDIEQYAWSSYMDYVGANRWRELLRTDIVLEQFTNSGEYRKFMRSAGAKRYLYAD